MSRIHKARLVLIHIGILDTNQKNKLDNYLSTQLFKNYDIIAKEGAVVKKILSICKENIVYLLILGALKKESLLQHYVGSIARKISRTAKCSEV